MRVRPVRLNASVALLFMVGASCFVLGSVPAYAEAVGESADCVTFFVGSIFFTSASFGQLLQAQTPAMTDADPETQHQAAPVRFLAWLPHDRNWLAAATQFPGTVYFNVSTFAALAHNLTASQADRYVWRPDFFGSTLFLVSSTFAVLALGRGLVSFDPNSLPWRIAWLNMIGSVLFMVSAMGSFVVPSTDELVNSAWSVGGTLLGAACFLVGAALMLPAWGRALAANPVITKERTQG